MTRAPTPDDRPPPTERPAPDGPGPGRAHMVRSIADIMARAPRGRLILLAALMLLASLTDGVGFLLIVPLLSHLAGQAGVEGHGLDSGFAARVDALLETLHVPSSLPSLLAIFVGLIALRAAITFARDRTGLKLRHGVTDDLRGECVRGLLGARWRWIAGQTRTDHMNLVLSEVSRVGFGLSSALGLVTGSVTLLVTWLAAVLISPPTAGLIALAALLAFLAVSGLRRSARALGTAQLRAGRAMMADVQHAFAGIKLAKILGNEERFSHTLMERMARLRGTQVRFGVEAAAVMGLQQVGGAVLLSAYIYAGLVWLALPLPELVALTVLFARIMPLVLALQQGLHRWINVLPALDAIDTFLRQSREQAEPTHAPRSIAVRREIRLCDVGLRYEGRDTAALEGIDLVLPARSTTALVGPSGAGKSTLADILTGLVAPDTGMVSIDGTPLDETRRLDWRHSVAYVPQEVFLVHDTVRANLLMAREDADEAALGLALERASAGFVATLPDGIDTVVGDDGLRLSGGERQRIALARALLRRPALLILDEATSALDTANELAVRDALRALHGDLTILLIGHRLATLEHADQVVLLEAGRLRRAGSWETVRAEMEDGA